MSKPEIVEKTPVCIPLVKEALKKIRKRDNDELNFRAQRTEEYVNALSLLKAKEATELAEKITEMEIPRLKPEMIHKIIDTMPQNEKHLKVILQGYAITMSPESTKKIVEAVQEYRKK